MALPPGFIDQIRERVQLSDIVGRKVTWDRRKSQPAKGDWWAPCPFHQEKTASFHVDDRKGFYYCFGCQAKGDLITFLREAENLEFIEAVERLAAEAGLDMPARDTRPEAAEARDARLALIEANEAAVRFFGIAFRSAAGQAARDYAAGRGLSDDTLARFEIGFAPGGRTALTDHLTAKDMLAAGIEAGLVIKPDDGGKPYDRFRNRLMFPIRDPRDRCIAFGGRALSPDAQAKYLNSPETAVFSKGRVLFNHGPARAAAGKAGTVVVAEGYMDVVALVAAGVEAAVAPLGTAITEAQLDHLWRMAPEPVVALDGDKAGLRAAHRLIDTALPGLAPGRSMRFCMLPEGQDPDDLIRAGGRAALDRAIGDALPLSEMLWRREAEAAPLETPEARAALDARLREVLGRIGDPSVKAHYRDDLARRRRTLFAQTPSAKPGPGVGSRPQASAGKPWRGAAARQDGPALPTRTSPLAGAATAASAARLREAQILLIAWRNPEAASEAEDALETMPVIDPEMSAIRDALLSAMARGETADDTAAAEIAATLDRIPAARTHPWAHPGREAQGAVRVLADAIARHAALLSWDDGAAEAASAFAGAEDEGWSWRLREAHAARAHALAHRVEPAETPAEAGDSALRRMLDALRGETPRS